MAEPPKPKLNRRTFLKRTAIAAAAGVGAAAAGSYFLGGSTRVSRSAGTKVIVIGVDGMDPRLSERMMQEGLLPNLEKLRAAGGYSRLGTSVPPQSPVAWANFINGNGPGSHGIFDFIHRHPHNPTGLFYSAAETIGPETLLRRQGVPFWDFLDQAGIPSTFYDLPCNYPPSPSHHGHHRCLAGMGTPDLLGTYGTYQHFAEDGPAEPSDIGTGRRTKLTFENETARAVIIGPRDGSAPSPIQIEFLVHRDADAGAAVIEFQGQRVVLRASDWSRWLKLDFRRSTPWYMPSFLGNSASGICRFYVQEVAPNFRLYVTPVNFDPSDPPTRLSEPESFTSDIAGRLGLFPTLGFQEAYEARKTGIFNDDEFVRQAEMVLEERLALFEYAVENYDDGLLFFYFSSSDLQSHILWWDSDDQHPTRPDDEARRHFEHIRRLYQRLDREVGKIVDRYGSRATIMVMSDHGFANFGKQFNLNSWLRDHGYLGPPECTSVLRDIDWARTAAYGIGLNGLYLNLKGRERDGIIEPGEQKDALLRELIAGLEAVEDANGDKVIRGVYRADQIYSGNATALAPDLIIGYSRGFRASWATVQGDLTEEVLLDNDSAWSADHCADALEVPGVLFSNRQIRSASPSLVDVAPSILNEFGLPTPSSMVGRNLL